MDSFYDVMKNLYQESNTDGYIKYQISDNIFETFRIYGSFLDDIPDKYKKIEADNLLYELSLYSQKFEAYENTYITTIKHMGKKRNKHIKIAKDFLDSLEYTPIQDIEAQYQFFKKNKKLHIFSERGILHALVVKYINQLEENKSGAFTMVGDKKYLNFYKKPSKEPIIKLLRKLGKEYYLKGYTKNIEKISYYLNDAIKE